MPARWHSALGARSTPRSQQRHEHPGAAHAPCLYAVAMREAIATQHGLTQHERYDLRACEGCGQPYLLATVWQPLSEPGALACPRCGAEAVSWDGAHGYLAYWQRDRRLGGGHTGHLPGGHAPAR